MSEDTELFSKEKFEFQTEESCILRATGAKGGTGEREQKQFRQSRTGFGFFGGCPAMGAEPFVTSLLGAWGAVARQAISRGLFETGCRPCVKRRQAVSGQRGFPERWQKSTGAARRENRCLLTRERVR